MEESNAFVIDSSYLLAYLLPDETILSVQKFFDQLKLKQIKLVTSPLLNFEVFNGLQTAISRKRITKEVAEELGKIFILIPVEFLEIDLIEVLRLAQKHNLTFYDGTYWYLSQQYQLPLLTLDKKLQDLS